MERKNNEYRKKEINEEKEIDREDCTERQKLCLDFLCYSTEGMS